MRWSGASFDLKCALNWVKSIVRRVTSAASQCKSIKTGFSRLYVLACVVSLLSWAVPPGMVSELCSAWSLQFAILMGTMLSVLPPRQFWLRGLGVVAIVSCIMRIAPFYYSLEVGQASVARYAGSGDIRLVALNVLRVSPMHNSVGRFLQRQDADVIFINELTPAWQAGLQPYLAAYPYRLEDSREGDFGLGIYSRLPLIEAKVLRHTLLSGRASNPLIAATINQGQRSLFLVGAHLQPPGTPAEYAFRNEELEAIASLVAKASPPAIVLGDLNTSSLSSWFQGFLKRHRFRDARVGFGVLPTAPTFFPFAMVPIDGAFVTRGVSVRAMRTGAFVWSDHLPVILDIRYGLE